MRFLLSKSSKKKLKKFLMDRNDASSLKELADMMDMSKSTLKEWVYNKDRSVPEEIIPDEVIDDLELIGKKNENWGQVKGGKKAYEKIIEKYGEEEIRKRQVNGGKKSNGSISNLEVDDELFLEFYGALLGDGWLSKLSYEYDSGKRNLWWIGFSGHSDEEEYLMYLKNIINKLFDRKVTVKDKKDSEAMEIIFSHKDLLVYLNEELEFPIGKKSALKLPSSIYDLNYSSLVHLIRGIFDTDGSFYLDKTPADNPYPCISIQMKTPELIFQLNQVLSKKGFKIYYRKNKNMITLKGKKQLSKWMDDIGSSNPKHLNKINKVL